MLRWLFGPTFFGLAAAFLIVKLFDTLVDSTTATANAARGTLFGVTWGGVFAKVGFGNLSKSANKRKSAILNATKIKRLL